MMEILLYGNTEEKKNIEILKSLFRSNWNFVSVCVWWKRNNNKKTGKIIKIVIGGALVDVVLHVGNVDAWVFGVWMWMCIYDHQIHSHFVILKEKKESQVLKRLEARLDLQVRPISSTN